MVLYSKKILLNELNSVDTIDNNVIEEIINIDFNQNCSVILVMFFYQFFYYIYEELRKI